MKKQYERSEMILGQEAMQKLNKARVAVFGIGGVGGHAVEAFARSGVGEIHLVDNDVVSETNLNRQLVALHSTLGRCKVDVMKERIADIDPDIKVFAYKAFFGDDTKDQFDFSQFDMVVDAIDSVSSKLLLIECATSQSGGIISAMGAGNKLDPTAFEVDDIYKTSVCPLARVMRAQLRKRGVKKLKAVYSNEQPITVEGERVPGSTAFVPSAAGLIIASEVIKELIK